MNEVGIDPYNRFADPEDPCANKHGGVATSQDAFQKARHGVQKSQEVIMDVLTAAYPEGMTGKEIAAYLDKPFNAVSGRMTELREQGKVRRTNNRRDGGYVMELELTTP